MFTQDAIKALAIHLNGRAYEMQFKALGALSHLLLRKRYFSHIVHLEELSALLHGRLEEAFPLPRMSVVVDAIKRTVVVNEHTFAVPDESPEAPFGWRYTGNPWSVVVKDEHGNYRMVACGDRFQIPHGEISVPFDLDLHLSMPNTLKMDNMVLSGSNAIWLIETWADFSKVVGFNNFDLPGAGIERIYNEAMPYSPILLNNEQSLDNTHLGQDLAQTLGLEVQPTEYSVRDLIETLRASQNEVEDLRRRVPKNVDSDADKLVNQVIDRIHNSIHFKDLLSTAMELPAKKRTQKALNELIPQHLEKILKALKANK